MEKKLIIPYFIFTLVGLVVHVVFCYIANEESLLRILLNCKESIVYRGGEEWNLALWFLVSLFFARITTSILSKIIPILIIFIISGAAAYGVHFLKLTYPVWIGNIFLGVFFYTMGYILRDIQYNKFFFYFSFLLFVFGLFFPVITKFDFRCNQVGIADNYPIVLLYCTFGIITINNLAYKFLNKPIRLITMIGKNSIIICVIHFPILMLSTNIARIMSITKPYYIITIASISISIIAYLSLIILRSNKFGFMIGR